ARGSLILIFLTVLRVALGLRVKLFNLLLPLFMFTWNHRYPLGQARGENSFKLSTAPQVSRLVCQEESQGVIDAILAFATVNIALTVFMFLNIVGLAYFFRMLLRMGVVHSSKAAPEGSLEASTEKVTAETAKLADSPQCPICLEDFSDTDESQDISRSQRPHRDPL
ncbi:unnamed protein product, partial [Symbiodinium microadriaticum]